jgi:peptidoglycan/xylan/chitin deacetylase (PgdA/CDA1 family)
MKTFLECRTLRSIRKQDLCVLLLYCLGYSKIRNMILRLQRKPVARFIAFHDIPLSTVNNFEGKLLFLKENTNLVSLDDFFAGDLSTDKINVVITFDDGYKSWITNALPILASLNIPATFFVSSNLIELSKADQEKLTKLRQFSVSTTETQIKCGMDWADLRRLAEEGFTIGGHTLNHINLAELRDSAQITHEIVEDKIRLEKEIGRSVEYFAYPLGAYKNPVINLPVLLKESGYKGALTTIPGFNNVKSNRYLLHRELTGASIHEQVFKARVFGNYDAVQLLKQWIRPIPRR